MQISQTFSLALLRSPTPAGGPSFLSKFCSLYLPLTPARRKAAAFPEDSRDTSMLAVIQKKKSFDEICFDYFKENKAEIAHAIPKLFPFLESLKDRSFITDKIYADSYEACRNLVPVEKVVYKILDNLEKLFGWSFLCTLFNRTNLKAYPGLREIHKNLETELEDKYLSQRSKQDQKLATVHPRCEQGTNLRTCENWTQPCFVKQESLQKPGTMQNQEDEVIGKDNLRCLGVRTMYPGLQNAEVPLGDHTSCFLTLHSWGTLKSPAVHSLHLTFYDPCKDVVPDLSKPPQTLAQLTP
ncbi:Nuclear body protein SP140 [Lemmus lemmus]